MSHMGMEVRPDAARKRIDVYVSGSATFIRLPKLVDTLAALPEDSEVHLHLADVQYIDHASMDAISTWQRQREQKYAPVVIEWEEAMAKYRQGNRFAPAEDSKPYAEVASH
jgi:MFS superfamily sulfate permease-like transporter